jgi:hypothetical protein
VPQQAVLIVEERDVPDHADRRSGPLRRNAKGGGHDAIDAAGAPIPVNDEGISPRVAVRSRWARPNG